MNEVLKMCTEIMNEFISLNEDLDISDMRIVDEEPPIVKEVNKQKVDKETVYLENYEYVRQLNPYEDYYYGTIAHKIKGSDYWIVCSYTA